MLLAAGCTQPTSLSHFDSGGISFDYPSTWNAATFFTPIGGATVVSVIVPTSPNGFMHVWGCLAGRFEGTIKGQFEAMLASAVWH